MSRDHWYLELQRLLRANGAVLKSRKSHLVYELPGGRIFSMAITPSCPFAYKNALADLKRVLAQPSRWRTPR